jgi:hypothetical protein
MFSLLRLLLRLGEHTVRHGDRPPRDPKTAMQIAGIVVVSAVLLNLAFYFLSGLYFEDRTVIYGAVTGGHISDVRLAFGVFTGSVAIASIVAAAQPRVVGHGIAALAGLMSLVAGVAAFSKGMTPVLPAALIVSGLIMFLLVWKSLEGARGAWAFLIGMTAVFSAVLLFGSTKVRGALDIGLWTALIIPGFLAVATVALAMTRDDYRDA